MQIDEVSIENCLYEILYIKATVMSVCVGSAWKNLPISCGVGDKQGKGRAAAMGAARGAISIKETSGCP
jgi:hypothetical protein